MNNKIKLISICIVVNFICHTSYSQDSLKNTIYFNYNSSQLTSKAKLILKSIAAIDTNSYKLTKVKLAAHCDQIGSNKYNDSLSKQRALSAKQFLIDSFMFDSNIIDFDFFGKRNLINIDTTEAVRQWNRRVEILAVFEKKIITTIKETPIMEYKKTEFEEPSEPTKLASKILDSSFKAGDTLKLHNILFYPGRHQFLAISNTQLQELFIAMRDIQTLQIEIHGHICCNLSKDDALDFETGKFDLSFQRAKAVFNFLVSKGIHPKRMTYKGFGHEFPLNEEKTSFEMQQNRRVEIKVISK
jgi:outer membrane protein OmpA-like peptidoglycan-associated protein